MLILFLGTKVPGYESSMNWGVASSHGTQRHIL